MSWDVANPELDENKPINDSKVTLYDLPDSWAGYTKEKKVQMILDVVEEQMRLVRNGSFPVSHSKEVAALALEGQMCLVEFYADAEAAAKNSKNIAEYIEAEEIARIAAEVVAGGGKRPSEVALKRKSLASDEVKEAKKRAIDLEKAHKKWRCVLDILKEAHVFFRRMSSND